MKSNKLAVSLSLAALIISAASFILNGPQVAEAQQPINPYIPVVDVRLAENYERHRALDYQYLNIFVPGSGVATVLTVPPGQRFMITSYGCGPEAGIHLEDQNGVKIWPYDSGSFDPGLPIEAGVTLMVRAPATGYATNLRLFGFYVDL